MTYAEYQESASRALTTLLRTPAVSVAGEGHLALACRWHILTTLTERMEHLGAGHWSGEAQGRRFTHEAVAREPLLQLARLVGQMTPTEPPAVPPSELLRRPDRQDAVTDAAWRTAARDLFLATTELQRAERRPWLERSDVAWPLVADLADTVQAVVLLDDRLAGVGALLEIPGRVTTARALVAGDVGRVARTASSDDGADLATAGWGSDSEPGKPSVALVRGPSDYAEAQRRLAGFVRPFRGHSHPGVVQDSPGLKVARVLAAGQTAMNGTFAGWSEKAGRPDLADEFRGRIVLYRALHAATARLVDILPARSPLALVQQSEMARQLRRGHGSLPSTAGAHPAQRGEPPPHGQLGEGLATRRDGGPAHPDHGQ